MDSFIKVQDKLSGQLQQCSEELYSKLHQLQVDELGMPESCLTYFKGSHFKRLFFSIQTSAHLLYKAISLKGKEPEQIVIMDYGAGVGTLYTLAKMIGCKQVIYNDHLPEWKQSAQLIAEAIGVQVDHYFVGDIGPTLEELKSRNIQCDVITSRNVIEHIYQLDHFYSQVYQSQPKALVYCSTTANHKNPASQIKHKRWHKKWEFYYVTQRKEIIKQFVPELSDTEHTQLAKITRGLAKTQILEKVKYYQETKQFPTAINCGSNTCDPTNGVWAEHMLTFNEYRKLIGENKYKISFAPGFWDTHYNNGLINLVGKMLNIFIGSSSALGFTVAPFIYVISKPIPKS